MTSKSPFELIMDQYTRAQRQDRAWKLAKELGFTRDAWDRLCRDMAADEPGWQDWPPTED